MARRGAASSPKSASRGRQGGTAPSTTPSTATRLDGWANVLNGIGTSRDKRQGSYLSLQVLTDVDVRALWRGDDIAKRAIETVPNEMFREGFEFKHTNPDLVTAINDETKRLKVGGHFKRAKQYELAYGGAAILPVINDGQDLAAPLNLDAITTIKHLRVLEPRELYVMRYDDDIESESFGEPLLYSLRPAGGRAAAGLSAGTMIHRSRLIIFPGTRITNDPNEVAQYPGWGDTCLQPAHEVLRDFQVSWSAVSALLIDFAQGVYKMDSLDQLLGTNDEMIVKRLQLMDLAKSVVKAMVIDGKDSYERQQTPISGLADVLDRLSSRLAAALRLPITVLMGQSPKGLGNEGDSDVRFLYDQISNAQTDTLPLLEQLYGMVVRQHALYPSASRKPSPTRRTDAKPKLSRDEALKDWSLEFCSLWQPTEKEIAETRKIVMDADVAAIDRGIVSAQEVRKARYGGDEYSIHLHVDTEDDDALDVDPARAAAMAGDLRSTLEAAPGTTPAPAPAAGAPLAPAAGLVPADTAMNGAQVSSLLDVIERFNKGQISRRQGIAVLARAFQIPESEAQQMLDEDFEQAPDPAAAPAAPPPATAPPPPATKPPPAEA